MENLEKRMFSLNLYNISPIQCGIQSGHSNMEHITENILKEVLSYIRNENNNLKNVDVDLLDWAINWKTVVLLNGGTTTTLSTYLEYLKSRGINCTAFYEPDLNMSLTSVSYLLDSNVFGKENVPVFIDSFFRKFKYDEYDNMLNSVYYLSDVEKEEFYYYKDRIGDKNLFLKFFTSKFSLSNN